MRRNPRPWEPCGWLRLIVAAVLMIILDLVSKALVFCRMLRLSSEVNRAVLWLGSWSGAVSDGGR